MQFFALVLLENVCLSYYHYNYFSSKKIKIGKDFKLFVLADFSKQENIPAKAETSKKLRIFKSDIRTSCLIGKGCACAVGTWTKKLKDTKP